jgi:Flp pilus assembly protein TadG
MTSINLSRKTPTSRESGQALVELSLVAPVLLALVLGIADFCRVFYASIAVSNAARAGAQYGIEPAQATNATGIQAAAVQDANLRGFTTANVTPVTYFCICGSDPTTVTQRGAATCTAALTSCSAPSVWVDVTTNYTFNTITQFPGFPNTVQLTGRAQMRAQ